MKKTYLEPKMEVVRLKMESLMTSASVENLGGEADKSMTGFSREGRGFGDDE